MANIISKRLLKVPASPIRKLVPYANQAKEKGIKVYHFNIGDPDIETPEIMLDVLKNWTRQTISYSQSQGEPDFVRSLKSYYHHLGYKYLNDADFQVTLGGSEAISMAFFAVTEPGDEIITFEPFYTNYNSYAAINGIKIVPITTSAENGFHLPAGKAGLPDRKTIESKIGKKTRAILICNPNNPTGTVYTREEFDLLADIAKQHQLFLISDEVYREFVFDGRKHVSVLDYFTDLPDQAILVDSLSKRYSLCGARLGLICSLNKEIMAGVLRMAQGRLSAGLVDQLMAGKLTDVPQSYFAAVHREYQQRRDVLYRGLRSIPGVFVPKPEGAFYCIVTLPVKDSEDFCKFLLTDFSLDGETVMFAPAEGFYATPGLGKNQIRIAYVLNTKSIEKLVKILRQALPAYRKSRE